MKVILLKDVAKIGKRHEVKEVASGYAQNFLIPRGQALLATPATIKKVQNAKVTHDNEESARIADLEKTLATVEGTKLTIKAKATEKGSLFAGIGKDELSTLLKEQASVTIGAEYLVLDKPLKEAGEHTITVQMGDKTASFVLEIVGE